MAVRRNPLYVFKNRDSKGISEVPLESIIQVVDSDGLGTPSMTLFIDKSKIYSVTTIGQYLATPSAYEELDRYSEVLNELEDVNFTSVVDRDVMVFDGANQVWVNIPINDVTSNLRLEDLIDVPPPTGNNHGQHLEWNDVNKEWYYAKSVHNLKDLGDVNPAPSDGDGDGELLSFDASTSTWKSVNIIHGGTF